MEPKRNRIFRYNVKKSYARRYNEQAYSQYSYKIRGRVLDLGAKRDNESFFRDLSTGITNYITIDLSPHGKVDVIGDGRLLPFGEDQFDTVIMSEVIEHLPIEDVSTVLREVHRVLRPRGNLLANVPFVYPIHGDRDFLRPTYHGVEHVLTSCNFDHEISVGGTYADVLLHVLEKPIRKISEKCPTHALLYLFSIFHYIVLILSLLPAAVLKEVYGRNPIGDYWYVTQFVAASPVPSN